jgi:predicted 3-demethylubiquinone-9 3-methyltransferase (glyoxalase superfamily)
MAYRSDDHRNADHGEAVSLTVTADEARAIDNWSATHHIGDRSEAIHRLVNLALDAHSEQDDVSFR